MLHHELALVVLGALVTAATWDAPNQTGFWTYMVLWVSRQSAKLNVFLGVRNLNESFLPVHLKYIQTYFRRKAMNPLFPVSVVAGTVVAWMLWQSAFAEGIETFDLTALTFTATLLSLAVLEHWFLVLPLPSEALWSWGMRSRTPPSAEKPS
jgi:putative photosynthetic complex assembly protein 2